MRLEELQQREDLELTLYPTLDRFFNSIQAGIQRMEFSSINARSKWYYHPIFGVWVTQNFCKEGIAFLCDYFEYTPNKARFLPQWFVINAFRVTSIFRAFLQPSFALDSPIEDGDQWMILPGNQRVRCFHFGAQIVRTYLKDGFGSHGLETEIIARNKLSSQFSSVLPLTPSAKHDSWEETFLPWFPLNRVSPKSIPKSMNNELVREIFAELRKISLTDQTTISSDLYAERVYNSIMHSFAQIQERWSGLRPHKLLTLLTRCIELLGNFGEIELGLSHGDFQAGNILVSPHKFRNSSKDPKFIFIDWEDSAQRSVLYDPLTFLLQARRPLCLARNLQSYLEGKYLEHPALFGSSAQAVPLEKRRAISALFLLEEWNWVLEVSKRKGISKFPTGLIQHFQILDDLIKLLQ